MTYGWNGRMSGFTLHYSHFTDVIEEHGHAFPLSPGLIPIGKVTQLRAVSHEVNILEAIENLDLLYFTVAFLLVYGILYGPYHM